MIEACIRTLMQGRLFEADIHTEVPVRERCAEQRAQPLFKI